MDWNRVAQDREEQWVVVNMVMNCQVAKSEGNFMTS